MTSLAFFGLTVHPLLTPIGILENLTMLGDMRIVECNINPLDGNGTTPNVGNLLVTFVNYVPTVGQKNYVLYGMLNLKFVRKPNCFLRF